MTINDKIKNAKLRCNLKGEAAKISALSSGLIDKCEYLTGEEILPSDQSGIIEQAKFAYSPLGRAFEKPIIRIEVQGQKQVEALETLKPNTQKLKLKDLISEAELKKLKMVLISLKKQKKR